MNNSEFRTQAHQFVDWMADFLEKVEQFPVKSQVQPGEIIRQLPIHPPAEAETMDRIFEDFQRIIMPGMTHWQSPNFFAFFPANSSYPSLLAEMLTATLGAQCMKWEASPAATELEELTMDWLKQMIGLPASFNGIIQDTASTASLVALLTARERFTKYRINQEGLSHAKDLRVYCSNEAHSSIEKAAKIAGYGSKNLVRIRVDHTFAMMPAELEKAIKQDISEGKSPVCVVATLGTTGSTAIDPLKEIGDICTKYNLWLHVDAAFAGSALILPDYRWMLEGIEDVDSFNFNPHKWLFTNFDCSAFFIKDKQALLNTFQIIPEYLKTATQGQVNDYCDWGIQLGRRFRALKLWFVIRSYGVNGLQEKLRFHIYLANKLLHNLLIDGRFELMAPMAFNLVCFRYRPMGLEDEDKLNQINEELLKKLNSTGRVYLSHTKLNGKFTLRMVIANTNVTEHHVEEAWELIKGIAASL